jgi:hypothetical protein
MDRKHTLYKQTEYTKAARMKPCNVEIRIVTSIGYKWISRYKTHIAHHENDCFYIIKVYGTEFHVLKRDVELV